MKKHQLAGFILAATIAGAGTAHATIIAQSAESIIHSPSYGLGGTFVPQSFEQFDQAMGQLNSVTIGLVGKITYKGIFTADPLCAGPMLCGTLFSFSTAMNFNAPGFAWTNPLSGPFYLTAGYGGWLAEDNLAPLNHSMTAQGIGDRTTSSVDGYIGTGNVTVMDGVVEDSDECNAVHVSCLLIADIDLLTTLTYDYTPTVRTFARLFSAPVAVPEPMSLALFGAGFIWIARKKLERK